MKKLNPLVVGMTSLLSGLGFAFIQSTNTQPGEHCDRYKENNATRIQDELSRQTDEGIESPVYSVTGKKFGVFGDSLTCTYTPDDF